jgi:hypothetical protein
MLLTIPATPDSHDPRLRELQHRIASGGYAVDSDAVATAIITHADLRLVPWTAADLKGRAHSRPAEH